MDSSSGIPVTHALYCFEVSRACLSLRCRKKQPPQEQRQCTYRTHHDAEHTNRKTEQPVTYTRSDSSVHVRHRLALSATRGMHIRVNYISIIFVRQCQVHVDSSRKGPALRAERSALSQNHKLVETRSRWGGIKRLRTALKPRLTTRHSRLASPCTHTSDNARRWSPASTSICLNPSHNRSRFHSFQQHLEFGPKRSTRRRRMLVCGPSPSSSLALPFPKLGPPAELQTYA